MKNFETYIINFPVLLETLKNNPFVEHAGVETTKGIYVFYENGEPIYVGIAKNIKNRKNQHHRKSSNHFSASFAFNLAKEKFNKEYLDTKKREELVQDDKFKEEFRIAKERVSKMKFKYMEILDDIELYLFEVYAAIELGTLQHNKFATH